MKNIFALALLMATLFGCNGQQNDRQPENSPEEIINESENLEKEAEELDKEVDEFVNDL